MSLQKQIACLAILCLAVFQANGRPHGGCDTFAAPYTAWNLLRHGTLDIRAYRILDNYQTHVHDTATGQRISIRPFGDALFMVPFLAPVALFRNEPPTNTTLQFLGKIAGTAAVIGSGILMFLTCLRLAPRARWPASLLLALGTGLGSVASQAIWNHGPGVFWVSVALYLLTREPSRQVILAAGFALGMATISRSTTAFFAVASGLALVLQRRWLETALLTLGGSIPVGLQALLNYHYFGNLVSGGYEAQFGLASPPIWFGAGGLLIAPSRGLLIYSPALLLVPSGIWVLWRRTDPETVSIKPLMLTWLAAAIGTLLFYGSWWCWYGGWCFGPRFLIETMPIFCLLFAFAYDSMRLRVSRVSAAALVALSVAVQITGLYGHNEESDWYARHSEDHFGIGMFDLKDTQIEAYARNICHKVAGMSRQE